MFAAVFTDLSPVVFTELLTLVFTELLLDDFTATVLPGDAPLLACFDLEAVFAPATLGGLSLGGLALSGAGIGCVAVGTLAWSSIAVISILSTAASNSPLVKLDSDSSKAASTLPSGVGDPHLRDPGINDPNALGSGFREVDYPPTDEWATVVDSHYDGMAVGEILH